MSSSKNTKKEAARGETSREENSGKTPPSSLTLLECKDSTPAPYSVYTRNEKWALVSMAALAGLFSPLTANIYLPVIPTLASAFNKSIELINLTVTVFMLCQGFSPMCWSSFADRHGRRPMFLVCLLLLTLVSIGLALTPTSAYWLLVLLRCFQAAGSASTIVLGSGLIADIADRSERGGFVGLFTVGPMFGPCIGPVIGGLLADSLGWRSIFWFIAIASGLCFLFMLTLLPETLRVVVGDGSIPAPRWDRPLIPVIGRGRRHETSASASELAAKKPTINPLKLFTYPDIVLTLLVSGIPFAVFYAVTASIAILFKTAYPFLNESTLGLCYLASGGGNVIGAVLTGRVLDSEYRRLRKAQPEVKRDEKHSAPAVGAAGFPIERARLRTMPVYLAIFVVASVGYGWSLESRTSIAVPLILQFAIGYTFMAAWNSSQTLCMDLCPTQSGSVTACNNVVRCTLGAISTSVIQLILDALGPGWTFVLLGLLCLITAGPMLFIEMHMGPKWRTRRVKRESTAL